MKINSLINQYLKTMKKLIFIRNGFRGILLFFLIVSLFLSRDVNHVLFNFIYIMLSIGLIGMIVLEIILFIKKKS